MRVTTTEHGFSVLTHPVYPPSDVTPKPLAQQSSMIGDYEDAFDRPGSSYLWIGEHHHLNREQVAEYVRHLQTWLDTGSFGKSS